jgi:L-lactate dehydrogenase complex protein LldG
LALNTRVESTLTKEQPTNGTRESMFAAIREQLAASAPFDAIRDEHGAHPAVANRGHRAAPLVQSPALSLTQLFCAALEAVNGHFVVVRDEFEAAAAVQQIVEQKNLRRIAVSDSPLVQQVMRGGEHDAELLQVASPADLFTCDGGITSAQWAIAETGTLVLESRKERHRLASLVPPLHIAIIEAGQIRQTMAEVLEGINKESLSRTVTFITGPSRTSDIELTLAIGVHGPAELHVVVIEKGRVTGV